MTDVSNVVPFERPRPKEAPPPFRYVEIRLRSNRTFQLTAVDANDDTVVFELAVVAPVTDANFERLAQAWDGWRNTSAPAS